MQSDNITAYALIALIIRVIGSVLFGYVLIKQLRLRLAHFQDDLNRFRELLIAVTLIPFTYNFLAIYNNYVRFTNGQQNESLNTATFFFGAVASTVTAIGFYLFYRGPRKK